MMTRSILVATGLAILTATAFAQGTPAPADRPMAGEDAMTDVDPELLARCKREAAQKKLKGSERATFMNACVEPED
jgi:hypothetical protein